MATNVHLTSELESFARACVKGGHYNNVSEVVRSGLRLLKEREDRKRTLDAMIVRTIKEADDRGTRVMGDVLARADAELDTDKKSERIGDSDDQAHVSDEQTAPTDARLHAAIVSDLEDLERKLTGLLTRWRKSSPCELEGQDEDSVGVAGECAAATARSMDALEDGEVIREKTEADTADEESTHSDRARSFWSSLSLTELAKAQGIAPVDDLEALAALWPSDHDPDELLEHLLAERAARFTDRSPC